MCLLPAYLYWLGSLLNSRYQSSFSSENFNYLDWYQIFISGWILVQIRPFRHTLPKPPILCDIFRLHFFYRSNNNIFHIKYIMFFSSALSMTFFVLLNPYTIYDVFLYRSINNIFHVIEPLKNHYILLYRSINDMFYVIELLYPAMLLTLKVN